MQNQICSKLVFNPAYSISLIFIIQMAYQLGW